MALPDVICPKRRLRGAVAAMFGMEEYLLPSSSRRVPVVRARYAFAYVARAWWPELSYPRIGRLLGGRDHSTILHGLQQFDGWLAADSELQSKVSRLLASRLSDQHDAHIRAWGEYRAELEREAERQRRIALFGTVRTSEFESAVADGISQVSAARKAKPVNALDPDDYDALRRKAGSDALGAALAAAGGWR